MPKRVLVVDDDPAQRRILEETIKRFGYNVATAESGDKALAALKADASNDICLVLLDLVMPGTDGMAVLAAMRTLPEEASGHRADRPWLASTPRSSAMRAGAVDFVVKPVSPERLEVSIKNALKIEALAGELNRIKAAGQGRARLRRPDRRQRGHDAGDRARQAGRQIDHSRADRGRIAASARS